MRMLDTFGTEHARRGESVGGGVAKTSHAIGADAAHGSADHLEDTSVTWQQIQGLRQGAEDDTPAFEEHFCESLLGGAWQQERTGRDTYGYQSVAKRHSIVALCAKRFGLSASAAFETNVYHEHGCTLSLLWRMRMYELARHWDENGRPELFPLASLNDFTPPEHLLNLLKDANEPESEETSPGDITLESRRFRVRRKCLHLHCVLKEMRRNSNELFLSAN
eukprot:38430-Amphidinium_carterae.3